MSRKPHRARRWLIGTLDRRRCASLEIDGRRVGRVEFRAAVEAHRTMYPHLIEHRSAGLARKRTARGRKAAVLASRPLVGCDHEFSYREDTIGDGFYTATERWLECDHCGAHRSATWEDAPSYDDYF